MSEDEGVDGILVDLYPSGRGAGQTSSQRRSRPLQTGREADHHRWMGGREAHEGREILFRNNIPTYDTPEEAVRTYLYMYNYERNLEILHETPADVPVDSAPPKNTLKAFVRKVLAEGRTVLTEEESKRFLADYRIPTVRTYVAADVEQAVHIARSRGLSAGPQDHLAGHKLQERCRRRGARDQFRGGTAGRIREDDGQGARVLSGGLGQRRDRPENDREDRLRGHPRGKERRGFRVGDPLRHGRHRGPDIPGFFHRPAAPQPGPGEKADGRDEGLQAPPGLQGKTAGRPASWRRSS